MLTEAAFLQAVEQAKAAIVDREIERSKKLNKPLFIWVNAYPQTYYADFDSYKYGINVYVKNFPEYKRNFGLVIGIPYNRTVYRRELQFVNRLEVEKIIKEFKSWQQ